MKECRLLHIHDGSPVVLENGNRHLLEAYPWAEETLNDLLAQGYEVRHLLPQVSPAIQESGCYSFYLSGVLAYLEREV